MEYYKKTSTVTSEVEEHFRFMADKIPDIVWTSLPDGYIDFYNSKFREYTGLSSEESEGFGWYKAVHQDDLTRLHAIWHKCLENGEPYEIEYRLKDKEGNFKWFLIRGIPWKDEAGNILKWFGTTTDIHYGKTMRVHLQKTTDELTKSNHELSRINDILNNFIYIAAHDLRSPINNMNSIFSILKEETDQRKKEDLLSFLEKSLHRLDRTVNGLIEVIRSASDESGSERLLFEEILQTVISDLSTNYPDISNYIVSDFTNYPSVKYVKPFLISILKNLLSNAYKYRSANRNLQIRIWTERDNDCVKIYVEDNGKGFNMKTATDIFKPFKRLTNEGEGTGVGLYVIKNIIVKNGGNIDVYSEADKGTTFTVCLKEYNHSRT